MSPHPEELVPWDNVNNVPEKSRKYYQNIEIFCSILKNNLNELCFDNNDCIKK
jgi:hypothetical protein